jgi:hypothetical protein
MDGYNGYGRSENALPAYTSLSAADLLRIIKSGTSGRITYANLLDQLTAELPDSIMDAFATKIGVGTWTASGSVSITAGVWQSAPFANYGTSSGGISVSAGQITITNTDPTFYLVKWRLQGNFSSSATIYGKLRSNVTGTPADWPFSQVAEQFTNDDFTIGDDYLIYVASSDVIDLQFKTLANETYQNASGYVRIMSVLPKAA